jgi:hypothetical protein
MGNNFSPGHTTGDGYQSVQSSGPGSVIKILGQLSSSRAGERYELQLVAYQAEAVVLPGASGLAPRGKAVELLRTFVGLACVAAREHSPLPLLASPGKSPNSVGRYKRLVYNVLRCPAEPTPA